MLTAEDRELIRRALGMYVNWIETRDPMLSANDCRQMGKEKSIQPLGIEQMRLCVKLTDIADKVMSLGA